MFNQDVQIAFSLAVREAQRRHHEFLTTEHILYAMLFDDQGQEILRACGGDVDTLREDLELYFDQHLEAFEQTDEDMPEQTVGLQNVLQRTVTHMQSSGREEIGIGDILSAILEQEDCLAAQILQAEGLSRLDVLNYVSHGITKVPFQDVEPDQREPDEQTKQSPGGKPAKKINPLEAFTVNLLERGGNDVLIHYIDILRESVRDVKQRHPFKIHAWVVLPDHLHCVIELPDDDVDYSVRWRLIRMSFSKAIPKNERLSAIRKRRGERGIWQRRYWKHLIRDEADYRAHRDCVHINPLKHGLMGRAIDWPHSTCHGLVKSGAYPPDWAGGSEISLNYGDWFLFGAMPVGYYALRS